MKKNLFNEINRIIKKKTNLSPTERSSLSLLIKDLEHDIMDEDIIAKELKKSESDMPGLSSIHAETTNKKMSLFYQKIKARIHHFESEHPDLLAAIDSFCTTLSNMGI